MKRIELNFNDKNIRIIIGLLIALVMIFVISIFRDNTKIITTVELSKIYTKDKIQKLLIDDNYLYFVTADGTFKIYKNSISTKALFKKYPVEVIEDSDYLMELLYLFVIIVAFVTLFKMMKSSRDEHLVELHKEIDRAEEIGKPQEVRAIQSTVKFTDVAGISDVKDELEEIIDFLRKPQKYQELDIKLPRGILLIGPPGVGKTLVSKAIAGEAGVPFFYQSGASFVHIYVGMGAKRVAELFKSAKQMAPSIIFIDEIDAVGKSRGEFRNDEREATLNELLTQMDGFEDSSGVIVIGATNKVEVLDEALLRAGRFDRRIHISLPDIHERLKTLELYMSRKPHHVELLEVARMTVGFNSAALATLVNEAALHAMRSGSMGVEMVDFEAVKDKVLLGKHRIVSYSQKERAILAIYQSAKALIATWLDIEFDKIGIVTTQIRQREDEIVSKSEILNRIKVYLAGSIATQKAYSEKYTNASSDIAKAKLLARDLIINYSMGDSYSSSPNEEEMILEQSAQDVETILEKLSTIHEKISSQLLIQETITEEETREILREIF
jgi:ATP-dependent metalloprotease FtsH